jgi:hypothetical protein
MKCDKYVINKYENGGVCWDIIGVPAESCWGDETV